MNVSRLLSAVVLVALAAGCAGSVESASTTNGTGEIAAQIGDRKISMQELDDKARGADMKAYQALYDARRQALDAMVSDQLLTLEAESRGMTKPELIAEEVDQKVAPPTDEQIEAFYNQNKASMRNKPLEEMSDQIQTYLANQNRAQGMRLLLAGIKAKHEVKIHLDPPRVSVTIAANDPTKGPAGAPIQILEYSDFQ